MSTPEHRERLSLLDELLRPEGRLVPRVLGVFRFDPKVYSEIAGEPGATPQAFAVVIATALITGIGQGSLVLAPLAVACVLFIWMVVAALVWAAAELTVGDRSHYAPLLRCLGFNYAWFALLIGYGLPWIGTAFGWAAVGLCLASNVLATRQVLEVSTQRAFTICAIALGTPLLLVLIVAG